MSQRYVLVCWHCDAMRQAGGQWQAIDRARFDREWAIQTRMNRADDGGRKKRKRKR